MLTAPAIGLIEQTISTSDTAPDTQKPIIDERRRPTYHQHKSAEYVLPNDSPEHQRLETQTIHLPAMMDNHVLHAPIKDGENKRMLDIGCGTGIITDLISSTYPSSECIGLDLSPVPTLRPRRPNTRFFQGNFTSSQPSTWLPTACGPSLSQGPELFDYIFSRLLILGMTDWPGFIKKELSLLKPGGWAEVHDLEWHWCDAEDNIISHEWNCARGRVCECADV
ncbi:Putative S-adenosyl-L-methionine-dependent methyltransferase [Septoria linicola]|uniref:S-adenosyl-L-methionine-dependent methyltransferase n=1 Tax=Septoria linicola TaxID=215465 RepID=A0A9Q9AZY7_9PEZI|nr:Putative S-adenosyl-L-methionine-dependent methyltransferase [Septoria linicola]